VRDDPEAFEAFLTEFDPERRERFRRMRDDPATLRSIMGGNAPMQRRGTPDEIGRSAVYLASDDASFVTGAVLMIDGGRSAGA